ncbi:Maf family nucleotide pyrophosphatase [Cyclobacterium jeungdonense]|uniref:dTTP/UTP pyrophosphatase n=1 Tax=Cyclobacterium jeungdonense TaxID=708087 RepID=A0ABT8CBT6_9BACT|nr:Maf family protein [Cyclobacterium jeungdonense]MDN3690278.1 Maf family protein [Cyclobacterium jeungdonense]
MEIKNKSLVLASKSPRRQQLLKEMGFSFSVKTLDTDEAFPESLDKMAVAEFLAEKKADAYLPYLYDEEVLITADTTVISENQILNKPATPQEAREMLQLLQGKPHEVITGVCIRDLQHKILISDCTRVDFSPLDDIEIKYYIKNFQPFDKAGGYGIQDWIGLIGISSIQGSYYTVMGLPVHKVYQQLKTTYELLY